MWAQALASNIKDTCCAAGADKVGHEATQKDMLGEIQQARPPKTISNPKNTELPFLVLLSVVLRSSVFAILHLQCRRTALTDILNVQHDC